MSSISIHTPREGSDLHKFNVDKAYIISIHTPREGSDVTITTVSLALVKFLSTLPARGATESPQVGTAWS